MLDSRSSKFRLSCPLDSATNQRQAEEKFKAGCDLTKIKGDGRKYGSIERPY
jgi:hypothetical protein